MCKLPVLSILLGMFSMFIFAGCEMAEKSAHSDEMKIVCTVFPLYEWTKEITGEQSNSSITLLADNGTDFHSYQPSTEDIVTIGNCDVLIYVGGESDKWIEDALENSVNSDMKIIKLRDVLGSEAVEEPETFEEERNHEHEDGQQSFDEHIWLSLKNAEKFCSSIADTLSEADTQNADVYKENAAGYIAKLSTLDNEFENKLDSVKRKTVIFGDRFPFVYMMEDYGLMYYAAFPGCSSETDASFDTAIKLAQKAEDESIPVVLTIEGSNCNIADAIISNTKDNIKRNILMLDSMQTVSSDDIKSGKTYLSVMEKNLDILMEALN